MTILSVSSSVLQICYNHRDEPEAQRFLEQVVGGREHKRTRGSSQETWAREISKTWHINKLQYEIFWLIQYIYG